MKYECDRCLKVFKQKIDWSRHKNRKKPCEIKLFLKIPTESKNGFDNPKMDYELLEENQSILENQCSYCKKTYSNRCNLLRHLRACKHKKDIYMKEKLLNLLTKQKEETDILKKKNETIVKQIEDLQIKLTENTNAIVKTSNKNNTSKNNSNNTKNSHNTINNTNNNTNNINIISYNNTKTDHITKEDWLKIMTKCTQAVPHLVEKIHYDPKVPENLNIYKSNMKNKYILKYNHKRWDIEDEDYALETLYYKNIGMLE